MAGRSLGHSNRTIQAKLRIGPVDDPLERQRTPRRRRRRERRGSRSLRPGPRRTRPAHMPECEAEDKQDSIQRKCAECEGGGGRRSDEGCAGYAVHATHRCGRNGRRRRRRAAFAAGPLLFRAALRTRFFAGTDSHARASRLCGKRHQRPRLHAGPRHRVCGRRIQTGVIGRAAPAGA